MRKKKVRVWAAAVLSFGVIALLASMALAAEPYREQEILFSVEETFSSEDIYLELSTFLSSDVYYTLDGSEPSDEDTLYEGPLLLEAGGEVTAYPVKAVAYYGDGTVSEVFTRTYFTGENISERFSTLIISITGEYEDLFDYETGILVTGFFRDNYFAHNPDVTLTDYDPANYNVRGELSERGVYVEVFDSEGNDLLGQEMGMRVNGGLSRGFDVKSLRLIARTQYGSNRIEYDFFSDEESLREKLATAADKDDLEPDFDQRIVLRNHGNDSETGYLRNELAQQLAADSGYPFTQRFTAVSVWINGEYYGFEWLEEYYDDVYLDQHYGIEDERGSWQIIEAYDTEDGDTSWVTGWDEYGYTDDEELTEEEREAQEAEELLEEQALKDIRSVMAYADKDLTDDAVFEELSGRMDIDNYLRYCAIEIYLANSDWPNNNIKAFRWYSDDGEYGSGEGTDGKWRFLFYDLDMSMARTEYEGYDVKSLALALGVEETVWDQDVPLLKALLMREDMRERFREIMEEYMEGAFSYDHVMEVLEEIQDEMAGELDYQMIAFSLAEAEEDEADFDECYDYAVSFHEEQIDAIEEFFLNRADVIREELDMMEEYINMVQ